MSKLSEEEKEAIDRLYMKATLYSVEAPEYPNSIVFKKDLVTVLDLIESQQAELEKQDKIINEMSIELYNYANLNKLGVCEAELENGNYDMNLCKMSLADRNCCKCIKEYFEKKVEGK